MSHIRRGLALILALCLLASGTAAARAAEPVEPYIQRMIQYYRYYQDGAQEEIGVLLEYIASQDPQQAALWGTIMEDWDALGRDMNVNLDILPDGLPEDASLCILVLGYDLMDDGTMRPELMARLQTTLRSAEKYPNARILVTGGATARYEATTEAEEMASWLVASGISESRILVENRAGNTTENAVRAYRILEASCPDVTQVAVISSDYHVSTGCVLFQTVATVNAAQGSREIRVVGNAGATTGKESWSFHQQARGIASITGIPYEENTVPAISQAID